MIAHDEILELLAYCYENEEPLSSRINKEDLLSLSSHSSAEIRAWLARALVYHNSEEFAVGVLSKLSQDDSADVRVEAVDSLSAYATHDSFKVLCMSLKDSDELVRAYAAFGIAIVGCDIAQAQALSVLTDFLKSEQEQRVLVGIYEGLYILGKQDKLKLLIELFHTEDYRVQCAVLHALEEILNESNVKALEDFIDSLDTSSYVNAVADTIRQVKRECLQINASANPY